MFIKLLIETIPYNNYEALYLLTSNIMDIFSACNKNK